MAELIENNKGFKVIRVSRREVIEKFVAFGICDWCNGVFNSFFYISVLNSCYCPKCYEAFCERSTYYPEDADIEDKNFEHAIKLLKLNEL